MAGTSFSTNWSRTAACDSLSVLLECKEEFVAFMPAGFLESEEACKRVAVTKMKVKSFTYERNWTGKYYRQRLLPSIQTMDKHIASMLNDGREIMTEHAHCGNSRGFRPFAKRDTITVSFRNRSSCRVATHAARVKQGSRYC
jgi:hypothetical protein